MAALRPLIALVAILTCGCSLVGNGTGPIGSANAGLTGSLGTGSGLIGNNSGGLIANNGANLISDNAAGLVSDNAAALISDNGANLISDNAAHLISDNAAGLNSGAFLAGLVAGPNALISDNAAHLVSNNAGGLISDNAASLISDNAASLISDNAASLISDNAASYRVQSLAYRAYKNVLVWFTHPDERFYAIGGRIVAGTTDARGRFRSAKPVVRADAPVIANVSLPFDRRMVGFLTTRAGSNSLIVDAASTFVVEYLRHEARRQGKTLEKFDLSRLSAMTDRTRGLLDSGALAVRPEHFVTGSGDLLAADYAVAVTRSDRSLANLLEQTIGQRPAAVATFAGNWEEGSDGDGGLADKARIAQPWGLAAAGDGLYVAEVQGHKIRRIGSGGGASASSAAGTIDRFLGTFAGHSQLMTPKLAIDGVPAASASLVLPRAVVLDADGNVFFSFVDQVDRDGNVLPNQVIAMLCRAPGDRFGLKGLQAGTVYRIAGTGASQVADASGTAIAHQTPLGIPSGIAIGAGGDLLLAEAAASRVLRVDRTTGAVTVVAGVYPRPTTPMADLGDGGPAAQALLSWPEGLAIRQIAGGTEELFVYDSRNQRIRVIRSRDAFRTGTIATVAGRAGATLTGTPGAFSGDGGAATAADLHLVRVDAANPDQIVARARGGLAADDRYLYIADANNRRIRIVDLTTGIIRTLAGGGMLEREGGAADVQVMDPAGLAVAPDGNLLFSDLRNHAVRKVWWR